jgi:hypothetical protein
MMLVGNDGQCGESGICMGDSGSVFIAKRPSKEKWSGLNEKSSINKLATFTI